MNIHKAVLPKMWFVLKDGGAGSADLIYPNLLPLIDLLPEVHEMYQKVTLVVIKCGHVMLLACCC